MRQKIKEPFLENSQIKYEFIKNKTCPYCQSKLKLSADFVVCPNCGTPHHKECWDENKGCTTYGCINNPNTERKINLGSEDVGNATLETIRESLNRDDSGILIQCQNCNSDIEEGSIYCKYCGFNIKENKFPEIKKETKDEFEEEYKKRYKEKINITRKRFLITTGSFVVLISAVAFLFYITVNKLNDYFSSDEYKIKSTVYSWKDAWEDKNLEKYKSYLTEDYQYFGKDGRKIELKEKLARIESTFKNYKAIKINFSDFKFVNDSTFLENDRRVQFRENYESEKFKENGIKTLRLYKGAETNGEWKIYREIFE